MQTVTHEAFSMGIIETPDPMHVVIVMTTMTQIDDDGTMIPTQRDIFPAGKTEAQEFVKMLQEHASDIKIVSEMPQNGR